MGRGLVAGYVNKLEVTAWCVGGQIHVQVDLVE